MFVHAAEGIDNEGREGAAYAFRMRSVLGVLDSCPSLRSFAWLRGGMEVGGRSGVYTGEITKGREPREEKLYLGPGI